MFSQLLAYVQTISKVIYYLIAIVSWYLAIATPDASANTPATEPDPDRFDSDNLSSSQIFDRAKAAARVATTAVNEPGVSPPTVPQQPAERRDDERTRDRVPAKTTPAPPVTVPPLAGGQIAQATTTPITLPFSLPIPISLPISLPLTPNPTFSPQSINTPINSILTPELIVPPNNTPAVVSPNAPVAPKPTNSLRDPRFILPPRLLDPNTVDPFSNQFILNGDKVSQATGTVVKTGFESGNFRSSDLNFNVYKVIGVENIQSVTSDSVVRVSSKIESVGVRSVERDRNIVATVSKPQTLLGVGEQISLDADCLDGSGRTCTFLPGITIDESNLNRQLQPTRRKHSPQQFGEVLTPASVAAIREPGFQGGANGQLAGIDLNIPAIGLVQTPWSVNPTLIGRSARRYQFGGGGELHPNESKFCYQWY